MYHIYRYIISSDFTAAESSTSWELSLQHGYFMVGESHLIEPWRLEGKKVVVRILK
jgi:hypothetical protein